MVSADILFLQRMSLRCRLVLRTFLELSCKMYFDNPSHVDLFFVVVSLIVSKKHLQSL